MEHYQPTLTGVRLSGVISRIGSSTLYVYGSFDRGVFSTTVWTHEKYFTLPPENAAFIPIGFLFSDKLVV